MSQKAINITLIIALVLVLILVTVSLVKANKAINTTPVINPTNPNQSTLGGALAGILGGIITGDWLQNLLGGGKKCDPANPGFTKSGIRDPKCGTPPGLECDPLKKGYNKAGLPDIDCGFGA